MKNLLVAITFILLIVTGCGENVDPVKGDINIQMKAVSELGAINTNARTAEMDIEFTEVILGVTEIELESLDGSTDDHHSSGSSDDDGDNDDSDDDGDDDSGEFEIEYEGQFIVDLIAGTSDPDFGIADLFPGTYKEIEVKLRPILDDGNSLFITFNYQPDSGDPVAVEISTKRELEFEVENHSGIQVEGNNLSQILILFNLDEIMTGIDFSQADVDEDGVIRINDSSNVAFTTSLLSNFVQSCKSGEDNDHDHEFDDDHMDDD